MDKNKYLRVFTDCYLVNGKNGSVIYDLSRNKLISISPIAYKVLKKIDGETIDSILSKFGRDIIKIIDYFIEQEICFLTDIPLSFNKINEDVRFENECYSAILEIGDSKNYDYINVIDELNQLGCQMLFISIKPGSDLRSDDILKILHLTTDSFFRCIDIVVPSFLEDMFTVDLLNHNIRISSITYLNSKESRREQNENGVRIQWTKEEELNWTEKIVLENFSFSLKSFLESKKYNIALNRKICIDEFGFIRNYVNHEDHFGNLSNITTSMSQVFKSPEFQRKWKINNDLIEICLSCKFRYCCLSNSDLHYSNNKWSKINHCQVFEIA